MLKQKQSPHKGQDYMSSILCRNSLLHQDTNHFREGCFWPVVLINFVAIKTLDSSAWICGTAAHLPRVGDFGRLSLLCFAHTSNILYFGRILPFPAVHMAYKSVEPINHPSLSHFQMMQTFQCNLCFHHQHQWFYLSAASKNTDCIAPCEGVESNKST